MADSRSPTHDDNRSTACAPCLHRDDVPRALIWLLLCSPGSPLVFQLFFFFLIKKNSCKRDETVDQLSSAANTRLTGPQPATRYSVRRLPPGGHFLVATIVAQVALVYAAPCRTVGGVSRKLFAPRSSELGESSATMAASRIKGRRTGARRLVYERRDVERPQRAHENLAKHGEPQDAPQR